MIRIQQLKMKSNHTDDDLRRKAASMLRIAPGDIREFQIVRKSLDARKKPEIYYIYTVDVKVHREGRVLKSCKNPHVSPAREVRYQFPETGTQALKSRPIVVGSGPAGLFCGLMLARHGYRPLILERGADAVTRRETVERFWNTGTLDERTNVQFGEGGAGTFSDGKLNTLVKDPVGRNRKVLEEFVKAGAPEDILLWNKPHIGTDILIGVVQNIRAEIERLGGEVRFLSQMTDIDIENGQVASVTVNGRERIKTQVLVLAIGHSARDTFEYLHSIPIPMQPKPFAVGVRVEHPQELINRVQYGEGFDRNLPAADYKLTAAVSGDRHVYSFCMCPGGYVVNASSEAGRLAVNGMSLRARDGKNANSAIVVTIGISDFGEPGALGGIRFQRQLEEAAYRAGSGKVPVQLFGDFVRGQKSTRFGTILPQIKGGCVLSNLREIFPEELAVSLIEGMRQFDHRIPGFAGEDVLLSGVESRTSSPVRILRETETLESAVRGLYPCGEGAGYAGGITSAAMDGIRIAEAVAVRYRPFS